METIELRDEALRVTLDTGVLDLIYQDVEAAAQALPIDVDFAIISVTDRERGQHESRPKDVPTIMETFVLGESLLGGAVLGSEAGARLYEQIRAIISSGSFNPPERDEYAHDGERRQVRDAMALSDHVRERRDVFITTDARAFINHGRREELEALCSTRIMTPDEFIDWCQTRG